ncbi:MAG: flagellar basal body P-ring formation chaperone FlgA [Steroidobacteraceae bacterium]
MMNPFANDGSPTGLARRLLSALLLVVPGMAAAQSSVQDLPAIADAATAFVRSQFGAGPGVLHVTVAQLDPRLRLPACDKPPQGFAPAALVPGARMTIGVRCTQPQWSVFVPVNVETEMTVLTLNKAIARLGKPGPGDIEPRRLRVPGFPADYLSDPAELAGRHLRMPAAPGTALTTALLVKDTLIRRGQRVTLVAAAGGVEVRARGEAVADASPAGRVRVLNLDSRRIVEGQAETADRVRVDL